MTTEARIGRVMALSGAAKIADLTPTAVLTAIQSARVDGKERRGISDTTANHYLTAVKSFSAWLFREKRTREDDLAHLAKFKGGTGRRVVRRGLEPEEIDRLIVQAERSAAVPLRRPARLVNADGVRELVFNTVTVNAPERAWTYRIAAGTGFRAGEVSSLTRESFDLDAERPTITCRAAYTKNRREAVQPIRRDLADLLRPWLATKAKGVPVCPVHDRAADIVRADLAAARIVWIAEATDPRDRARREASDFLRPTDHAGRVADFHCLRGAYISRVVETGATLKICMELSRHSDPKLTLNTYAKARMHDVGAAIDRLPATGPSRAGPERVKATGTDGRETPARSARAARVAANGGNGRHEQSVVGEIVGGGMGALSAVTSGVSGTIRQSPALQDRNADFRTRTPGFKLAG